MGKRAAGTEDSSSRKRVKSSEASDAVESSEIDSTPQVSTEPEDESNSKYQRLILFVGQLPYDATSEDVAKHFKDHGVGKVSVRLLTDKTSGKSKGTAFVDFETPQQLVRGLRLHRTRLMGRSINVERTVGGGGTNPKRQERLSKLREFQGTKVEREVDELLNQLESRSEGLLTKEDFDPSMVRALCQLPRDAAAQVLEEVLMSDIKAARSKKAWIFGFLQRYHNHAKAGEAFLTMSQEKAGIIERTRGAAPFAGLEKRNHERSSQQQSHSRGSSGGGDRRRSGGETVDRRFKFARGNIGAPASSAS